LDHIGITLLKVTGFIAFMLIIGKRLVPMIMQFVARLGSRELFTLTVLLLQYRLPMVLMPFLEFPWHWGFLCRNGG
jgi:predicted Kef-type K+ transport protein